MSFGGHVNDMINSVKQNTALKNARRKKFKGGNDYSKTKSIKTAYNIPKLSKSDLDTFKKSIAKEAIQEKKKQILYWVLGIVAVLISILIFNFVGL